MIRIFRASLLSPTPSGPLLHVLDGALAVGGDGRIADLGEFPELRQRHPEAECLDLRPHWILPGLVDLHTHLPQLGAVAMDGLELLPWLERHIYPEEGRFGEPGRAASVSRAFFRGLLAHGTTTAVVYGSVHAHAMNEAFAEAETTGLRVVMGKVMMDRHVPGPLRESAEESLRSSEDLCQRWHGRDGGRLQYVFSPRFAPACSMELMQGAGRLAAKHGAFVQTHVSESPSEIARVRELFPEASNYTDVYARAGLLGSRTFLGHGIHLDAEERRMIRESGTHIVHCPRSNAFLKSGIMPLRRWLDEGLSVGLGTDVGAGPSLSLWAEMAMACQVSKLREALVGEASAVDPVQAFRLATLEGARALGMEGRIGSLETGKDADFIVVDPRAADPFGEARGAEAPEQVLSRMVYREESGLVRAAYVRGRECFGPDR